MAGGLMCTFLLCLAAPLVSANGQERNDAALHSREQQYTSGIRHRDINALQDVFADTFVALAKTFQSRTKLNF